VRPFLSEREREREGEREKEREREREGGDLWGVLKNDAEMLCTW
jgi:hypothetical protein